MTSARERKLMNYYKIGERFLRDRSKKKTNTKYSNFEGVTFLAEAEFEVPVTFFVEAASIEFIWGSWDRPESVLRSASPASPKHP